jgi:hypothetical protein
VGGSQVVDINGGSGAWTSLGLVVVGSLVILGGTVAAVLSWIGALLHTWQLEDKLWFASLLAAGVLGFGVVAMIAYVVAGPDGANQSAARRGIAREGRPPRPALAQPVGSQRTAMPAAAAGTSASVSTCVSVPSSPTSKVTMPCVPAASTYR